MNRLKPYGLGCLTILLATQSLFGAATNEQNATGETWQKLLSETSYLNRLPSNNPLFFKNNTNIPIELIYKSSESNAPARLEVKSEDIKLLSPEAREMHPVVGISAKNTAYLPTALTEYAYGGFKGFNLEPIITQSLEANPDATQKPITLTLARQTKWGVPTTSFNITASATDPEFIKSMKDASDEDFEILEIDSERALDGLENSNLIFYNGSHFSVALTYEQDEIQHRIIVAPGSKANLGKNIATGINIETVSVFGGTSSPLPIIAQHYQSVDFNLIDILKEKAYETGTYQINLPATSWKVTSEKLDAIPKDAIQAEALQLMLASEQAAQESQAPFDEKTEIKIADMGRELYEAIKAQDTAKIVALRKGIKNIYVGNPNAGLLKALTLYFYYIARKLGHIFEEGTFVVYDPTATIYPFIEDLEDTYTRKASHLNALASKNLPESERKPWLAQMGNNHRGHDVDIPAMHKKTLLFNYIHPDKTAFYLKPESHGTKGLISITAHGIDFLRAQGRKQLPSVFGSDDQPAYSKERIPKEILRNFLKMIEQLPVDENVKADGALRASTYGIQYMFTKARELQERFPENALLNKFIQSLEQKQNAGDPKYSYLAQRFGNEVILTPAEFEQFKNQIRETETFNRAGE